jgi:hypothetical protein
MPGSLRSVLRRRTVRAHLWPLLSRRVLLLPGVAVAGLAVALGSLQRLRLKVRRQKARHPKSAGPFE